MIMVQFRPWHQKYKGLARNGWPFFLVLYNSCVMLPKMKLCNQVQSFSPEFEQGGEIVSPGHTWTG